MRRWIAVSVVAVLVSAVSVYAVEMSDLAAALKAAKRTVNTTLADIGSDIAAAAKNLSRTDLKSDDARKILDGLRKYRPYVVNCSILNPDGVKVAVEPAEYKQCEGADRTELPYVVQVLRTKRPVMSDVYHAAEGMHAITIAYPIVSENGSLLGVVRMLIRYEDFLKPLLADRPYKMWVMQKNGLIVYDADPEEIGKNIFTDPMFKPFDDLISFSHTVSLSSSGAGSYNFYAQGLEDKTLTEKVATWDTVGLYGTDWRIIAMDIEKTLAQPATTKEAS